MILFMHEVCLGLEVLMLL